MDLPAAWRDHVVVCGVRGVGYRVIELVAASWSTPTARDALRGA